MKNLQVFVEPDRIQSYVFGLFRSDLFRENSGSFVHSLVADFARVPRMFAEMTNPELENSHFSTWWNVIMLREYSNPVVADLYLLHEMYHASTMPYVPGIGKAAFDEKMQRNELEASVMSEIMIYFAQPGLRSLSSFPHLYADRFLDDPRMVSLWQNSPTVATETIRSIRRDVMVSKPEHLMDVTERWIRRFAEQNAVYSITWANSYLEVETRMADFHYEVSTIGPKAAAERHAHWIAERAENDWIDNIPFRQEAALFAPFYWANKQRYSSEMAAG